MCGLLSAPYGRLLGNGIRIATSMARSIHGPNTDDPNFHLGLLHPMPLRCYRSTHSPARFLRSKSDKSRSGMVFAFLVQLYVLRGSPAQYTRHRCRLTLILRLGMCRLTLTTTLLPISCSLCLACTTRPGLEHTATRPPQAIGPFIVIRSKRKHRFSTMPAAGLLIGL